MIATITSRQAAILPRMVVELGTNNSSSRRRIASGGVSCRISSISRSSSWMAATAAIVPSFVDAVRGASKRQRRRNFATTTTTTTTQSHAIRSRRLENVHPLHLFRIVQDVDHYKDFLPLCSHSHVWKDSIREGGRCFEADLVVGYASFFGSVFRTGYRSEVVVDPEQLTIETNSGRGVSVNNNNNNSNYTDGDGSNGGDDSLFESLHSKWSLTPVAAVSSTTNNNDNNHNNHNNAPIVGTVVDFEVTMTVANPMVVAVLDTVLVRVAETQVAAFSERCRVVPPPTPEELERAERFYPTIGNR